MCGPVSQLFLFFIAVTATSASLAPTIDLNDGNKIPVVALGTGRGTAKQNETLDSVHNAVYWAIEAGYRHIDTAAVYKDEEQVGRGIADAIAKGLVTREELFITTKLWSDKHATEQVVPELRRSLQRLGLDYVDLYLIHFPIAIKEDGTADDIDYLDTWKGMEEAQRLGLTKSIGVSNFNSEQMDRLMVNSNIKPAVNQVEVNPTFTQEDLVSHCQKHGVAVMAYSPFGFLVARKTPNQINIDETKLEAIAHKYKKNKSQIILRYLLDRGLIVIPKSTNKERIAQNIDLFDFRLTADEVATISEYNTNTRVINASSYKNFPYYPFEKN